MKNRIKNQIEVLDSLILKDNKCIINIFINDEFKDYKINDLLGDYLLVSIINGHIQVWEKMEDDVLLEDVKKAIDIQKLRDLLNIICKN